MSQSSSESPLPITAADDDDSGKLFMLGIGVLFAWMAIMVFFAKPTLFQNMFRRCFFCFFTTPVPSAEDLERRGTRHSGIPKSLLMEQLAAQQQRRTQARRAAAGASQQRASLNGGDDKQPDKAPMTMGAAELIQAVNHSKRRAPPTGSSVSPSNVPLVTVIRAPPTTAIVSPPQGRHRDLARVTLFETIHETSSGSSREEIAVLDEQRERRMHEQQRLAIAACQENSSSSPVVGKSNSTLTTRC